jgi:hypothetical protein
MHTDLLIHSTNLVRQERIEDASRRRLARSASKGPEPRTRRRRPRAYGLRQIET